ncbi:hypothetical protein HYV81_01965 [Candidatus Woesearchaeota archaeon]|nr:hypothetical protein [Candidatus Woesearchaeota archaeon]
MLRKIGFTPHPTMRRIYGAIHLDHVPWNFNKLDFDKESEEYEEAIETLENELTELRKMARQKSTEEKLSSNIEEKKELFLEKVAEVLNNAEEFKDLRTPKEKIKQQITKLTNKEPEGYDLISIEKRNERTNKNEYKVNLPESERTRIPKKTQQKKRLYITISGQKINFKHEFQHFGSAGTSKEYHIRENNLIEIYSNYDFPAYMVTEDKAFYALSHVAECISSIIMETGDAQFKTMDECRDKILRLTCEKIEQFREKY